jgi:hypothetical protein
MTTGVSAVAFTVVNLTTIRFSIFSQRYESSYFTATTKDVKMHKKDVILIITVTNGNTVAHSASVTVTCYNSGNNVVQELTQTTGSVNANTSLDLTFTFDSVTEVTYSFHEIQIKDLT